MNNKCAQKIVLHLLIAAGLAGQASAQQPKLMKFEKQVQTAIAIARPASVYLRDYNPNTKAAKGGRFSGVVVDAEGTILTVAHATGPNRVYLVTFPDGRQCTATGMGRIAAVDAAVLKINEKGTWPFAEMGWSSSLKVNEPCLSIAYPASFDTNVLVVRFGYVEEVSSRFKANSIRTTCLMEPGDSGGPAFDLLGRVIGLHSSINIDLESNFEVPVDLYRKYWNALQQPLDYDLPIGEQISADPFAAEKFAFNNMEEINPLLSKLQTQFNGSDFKINSSLKGKNKSINGTLINLEGLAPSKQILAKSFLISKNSMVGDEPSIDLGKGNIKLAKIIARDEARDLVLLELETSLKNGLKINDLPVDTLTFADLGEFLISPLPDGKAAWSVAGTTRFNLPRKYSAGYIGSATEFKDRKVILSIIQANSAASAAKLEVGDEIVEVNGTAVHSPERYIAEVRKYKPNEKITISRIRSGITEKVEVTLKQFPLITSDHPAEKFIGGKSVFRDGFANVFVHDAKLSPEECGGPVFNCDGRCMGINIARYSRTSTIVLTVTELKKFIESSLQFSLAKV